MDLTIQHLTFFIIQSLIILSIIIITSCDSLVYKEKFTNLPFGRCHLKHFNKLDSINCPNKSCSQHIDCWVSYGPSQRCVCDPIKCGSVCLQGKKMFNKDYIHLCHVFKITG